MLLQDFRDVQVNYLVTGYLCYVRLRQVNGD